MGLKLAHFVIDLKQLYDCLVHNEYNGYKSQAHTYILQFTFVYLRTSYTKFCNKNNDENTFWKLHAHGHSRTRSHGLTTEPTLYVLPGAQAIPYLPRVDRAVLDSSRCFPLPAGWPTDQQSVTNSVTLTQLGWLWDFFNQHLTIFVLNQMLSIY